MSPWYSNFLCHLLDTNENGRLTLKTLMYAIENVEIYGSFFSRLSCSI